MSLSKNLSLPTRLLVALGVAIALLGGLLVASAPSPAHATTPPRSGKDVILNLFQWTWDSVAAECTSTIGPSGYGYVQVSPPQETIQGAQWWTSYQPVSYRLDSKLGTRAEFAAMVAACNSAGVGVIVDAVINHMSGADIGSGTGVAGSSFGVDSFPAVPYGFNDFNDCRVDISNYKDRDNVQFCRLSSLQDLRTSSDYVRTKIAGYLNDLISLGVSGFRIDAAKHIPAADLLAIKQKLTNPNIYWVQEVIRGANEPIQPSEYLGSGDSHEFDYARRLKADFDGSIANLKDIANGLLPSTGAGVFVDNHDTERNGETMNYQWGAKYLLANMFMLSYPYGSPAVYSGYAFTGSTKDTGAPGASATSVPDADCSNTAWQCTQRKQEIRGAVAFHNAVTGTDLNNWFDDGSNVVAYGRGDKGFVAINNTNASVTREFATALPPGTYCNVVSAGGCSQSFAVSGGKVTLTIPAYGGVMLKGTATPQTPTTVYYSTAKGWSSYFVHYRVGSGAWTTAPGDAMTAACAGWVSRTVSANGQTVTAAFTNGSGTWDNNGSNNYSLTGADVAVSANGTVTGGNPCTTPPPSSTTVYYSTAKGWSSYFVHYRVGSGAWTTAPGDAMTAACAGWVSRTVSANGQTVTAAFTNGAGTWDNNGSNNYSLTGADVAVSANGAVTAGSPCTSPQPGAAFGVAATVSAGQSVYVVGDIAALGAWAPGNAVALTANGSTWTGTVGLPAGTTFQYKYIKRTTAGAVTWESGANRTATVGANGSVTLSDTWRN
ncbi:carbohydrate binding domain-containing protein [Microbacterium sp. AZCO]|uniref:carbohydrate binding domain-containing protein n=1 Tax=Microbacterium sp. AZCO TaxID=3142976 RepID=UPI0031F46D31